MLYYTVCQKPMYGLIQSWTEGSNMCLPKHIKEHENRFNRWLSTKHITKLNNKRNGVCFRKVNFLWQHFFSTCVRRLHLVLELCGSYTDLLMLLSSLVWSLFKCSTAITMSVTTHLSSLSHLYETICFLCYSFPLLFSTECDTIWVTRWMFREKQ